MSEAAQVLLSRLKPWLGLQLVKVDGSPLAEMRVARAREGSALEAGMPQGAVLERIDGQPARTHSQIKQLLRLVQPGDRVAIQVERLDDQSCIIRNYL